jgi:hypothetical protein
MIKVRLSRRMFLSLAQSACALNEPTRVGSLAQVHHSAQRARARAGVSAGHNHPPMKPLDPGRVPACGHRRSGGRCSGSRGRSRSAAWS